jgi:hypothetical protein
MRGIITVFLQVLPLVVGLIIFFFVFSAVQPYPRPAHLAQVRGHRLIGSVHPAGPLPAQLRSPPKTSETETHAPPPATGSVYHMPSSAQISGTYPLSESSEKTSGCGSDPLAPTRPGSLLHGTVRQSSNQSATYGTLPPLRGAWQRGGSSGQSRPFPVNPVGIQPAGLPFRPTGRTVKVPTSRFFTNAGHRSV